MFDNWADPVLNKFVLKNSMIVSYKEDHVHFSIVGITLYLNMKYALNKAAVIVSQLNANTHYVRLLE